METTNAKRKNAEMELAKLRRELVGIDDLCIPTEIVGQLRELAICDDWKKPSKDPFKEDVVTQRRRS